jgi:hypothetical protein
MEPKFKIGDVVVHSSCAGQNEGAFLSLSRAVRMTIIGVGTMSDGIASAPIYMVSHFDGEGRIGRTYACEAELAETEKEKSE